MNKSQKGICTSGWWYQITILNIGRRPSQFCELSAMITKSVTDTAGWFCESLWKDSEYRGERLISIS